MRLGRNTFARMGIIIMCFCLIVPTLGIVTDSAYVYGATVPPAKTISYVNTGNQATDIVEIARTQIGYKENRISDKVGDIYTAYGEYFKYRYEWCAVFVCWCGKKAGISNMTTLSKGFTTVADPTHFKGTYYARGKVTPQKGDLIFFDWDYSGNYDHVGLVDYVKNGTVYTIEGNDRYGKVASKSYSLSSTYIRGYKRPNYTNNPVFVEPKGTKTILDGRYHIVSALNNDYCLDVKGASKENGANIQLYTSRMDPNQTWNVSYLGDGYYKITSWNSGKSIDVDNSGKTNGTNALQWQYNASNNQKWVIRKNSDGSYSIVSKCNGLCLEVKGSTVAKGTNVQMWADNLTTNQKFYFVEWAGETISSGRYHIVSKLDSSKCLDVRNASTSAGANVQLYSATEDPKQTWNVTSMGNGFYKITNYNSGLSLDVYNNGKADGTNVQQWTDNGGNNQRWALKYNSGGYYNIISKCSGLYVDVSAGKTANGTNIQTYLNNETAAQQWIFVPYTETQNSSSENSNSSNIGDDTSENNGSSEAGNSTTPTTVSDNKPIAVSEQTVEQIKVNNIITKIDAAAIKTKGSTSKRQMAIEIPQVAGAADYILAYKTAKAKTWKYFYTGGSNKYIIKGLKLNSVIQFKVAAYSNGARGDWSNICYRYLMNVKSVKTKAGNKSMTVTWKKDAKATGYQILYSTNKNMKGCKTITIKGANKTKKAIKGVKKGKTYYVRLRPIKKYKGNSYLGILTPAKSVKVK